MLKISRLTTFAPAKVNIHLAVLDKRQDGFHNLESLFLAVDFGDILYFEPLDGKNRLELTMNGGESIPVEKNIIFKALNLFREKTGCSQGVGITVEKHIPLGGGVGGGSSDAAAVLLALNKLTGFPLSRAELLGMAASLGSDVPFFIHETPAAWVTGRGEHIEPLDPPGWYFVLVNPGFASDTGEAFSLLDEHREEDSGERGAGSDFCPKSNQDIINHGLLTTTSTLFKNDFLPVIKEPQKSIYNGIISRLTELGAEYANLSGSGSTCFGVFKEKKRADKAALSLKQPDSWFVKRCTVWHPR